jgi:hypothetical protein
MSLVPNEDPQFPKLIAWFKRKLKETMMQQLNSAYDILDYFGEFSDVTPITAQEAVERFKQARTDYNTIRCMMSRYSGMGGATIEDRRIVDAMWGRILKQAQVRLHRSIMWDDNVPVHTAQPD